MKIKKLFGRGKAPAAQDKKAPEWKNIEYFDPTWEGRVVIIARLIKNKGRVVDFGCGEQYLRKHLPAGCQYIPVDYKSRSPDTIVADFNTLPYPKIDGDTAFISGFLEYVVDAPAFVKHISGLSYREIVMSYCSLDSIPDMKVRTNLSWKSHLTIKELLGEFLKSFNLHAIDASVGQTEILRFEKKKLMGVLIFNPSLKDHSGALNSNLGDIIIAQAVIGEIKRLFPDEEIVSIASHAYPDGPQRSQIKTARHRIVGGTNVLSSDMRHCRQWRFSPRTLVFHPAILCGVGWQDYQDSVTLYTKVLLHLILSRSIVHSVRDGYTKQKLAGCGVRNVVNTSCPTLWPLAGQKKVVNARKPGKNVLLMITDYRKDEASDRELVRILADAYEKIYFWPQGEMDLSYLTGLFPDNLAKLVVLERTLEALDTCLADTPDLDYVGTRLHGGIRCLHAGKRGLILEVDNRAREIARETGLPSLPRTDLADIKKWVQTGWPSEIHVDEAPIKQWRAQFGK